MKPAMTTWTQSGNGGTSGSRTAVARTSAWAHTQCIHSQGRNSDSIGAENVRAFHLSDTRALLGSHREHHWHWGKGYLRGEGLRVLLGRPEYATVPGILETPYEPGADRVNMEYVRGLLD